MLDEFFAGSRPVPHGGRRPQDGGAALGGPERKRKRERLDRFFAEALPPRR